MTAEKKKYEFMRIIALDGSTIYRSQELTAMKNGKINSNTFSGVLDDSLETIKLREIYAKHEAEIGYPYLEEKAFCRAIVSVSFDYAIKQYEKQGRRYVLYGQTVTDEEMTDHVCIRTIDGEPTLVAIETPLNQDRQYAPVEQPLSAKLLGKYFVYDAEKREYKRSDKEMPSVVKKEQIREHLYLHGFDIDGIHYVRYKRSAGSSRDGRCLFIAKQLYARLKKSGRKTHVDKFGEGLSDRMVRSCHTTCRTALEKAKTEGLIRVNPAVGCKLPPKKAKEMQVLTPSEITRFLIQAKEEGYYELFLLELITGMRRGEILALKWRDLNLKTGELHISRQVLKVNGKVLISTPKTKSSNRMILLPPEMLELLAEMKARTDSEWIFPSPVYPDEPRNPSAVYHRFQKILERANCKRVRFHDLRHTFATMALENGMDIKTLSAMIGHVSAKPRSTFIVISPIRCNSRQRQKLTARLQGLTRQFPSRKPRTRPVTVKRIISRQSRNLSRTEASTASPERVASP